MTDPTNLRAIVAELRELFDTAPYHASDDEVTKQNKRERWLLRWEAALLRNGEALLEAAEELNRAREEARAHYGKAGT